MTVIVMTREMGTLGKDVAAGLAEALGTEVVHQELVEHHLAQRLQLDESTVHRFLEGGSSLWERWKIDPKRMSRYTADKILQLANRGNVLIRGWGAAQLLRDIFHVLCVRICAPMSKRVAVMMERLGITDERVMRLEIERSDNAHSRAIQRQFGGDWRDPENYDIVLNTGFLSVKTCVALVQQLSESSAYKETKVSRGILANKAIQAEVRKVLDANTADTPFGSGIHVTVEAGNVTLAGIVSGNVEIGSTIEEIRRIEGVTGIKNNVSYVSIRSGV